MQVAVAAHPDTDLSQRMHVVVDGVKVLAYPEGFVRTGPTKAGHYLYWESGCIFVTVDADGTKEIAGEQEFPIIDASIATWNDDVASCSYIKVVNQGKKAMEVGKDNVNLIKFRDVSWCRPASRDDPARCYADSAAGITTATYVDDATSSRDGAIVDADIEINGVNFAISLNGVTAGTASCKAELQNTLTHEIGHLHGLEHTCLAAGDPPRTDDQGRPVPSCQNASDPAILNATMYNFQDCGETKKESLEADDINGMCVVYPTAKDPGTCEPVGAGAGCCSAQSRPTGPFVLSVLVGLVLVRRRNWRPRA
jgi:MYXO-CTERM domain-containing protein